MKTIISIFALLSLIFAPIAQASQTPIPQQEMIYSNLLTNPGFENGIAGWTASGGATKTANATAKGLGSAGYDWDSNSAAQTLLSASITIPASYYGSNGQAFCRFKTVSGTATHTITVNDGTNDIVTAATIESSTSAFVLSGVTFPFPLSGTIRIKITSVNANEPEVYIDECYLGRNAQIAPVHQITNWVSYTPTGTWTGVTYTGKWRRVGDTLQAKVGITMAGAPSGGGTLYVTIPSGLTIDTTKQAGSNGATTANVFGTGKTFNGASTVTNLSVSYGTTGANVAVVYENNSAAALGAVTTTTPFTYASGMTVDIEFMVPISGWISETAYRPDATGVVWTSYTPTLKGGTNGSTFTNQTTTGMYRCDGDTLQMQVYTVFSGAPGTGTGSFIWTLPSGFTADTAKMPTTNLVSLGSAKFLDSGTQFYVGTVTYNSAQSGGLSVAPQGAASTEASATVPMTVASSDTISFIANVPVTSDSPCSKVRAPLLVGSVTSNSSGAERIERATVALCSSSPCTITSQSGTWLSSITRASAGNYTANFPAGMWITAPTCLCTTAGGPYTCVPNSTTTTTSNIQVFNNTFTNADGEIRIMCMGPR